MAGPIKLVIGASGFLGSRVTRQLVALTLGRRFALTLAPRARGC